MLTINCDIQELRKKAGIYYIINLVTKRKYIGSSFDLYRRWQDHSKYSSNFELKQDIKQVGIENFIFKVIDVYDNITKEELLRIEQEHLNDYFAIEYLESSYIDDRFKILLYNYLPTAHNGSVYSKWKEHSKQKLKERNTGSGNPSFGKKRTDEQRKRASEGAKKSFLNGRVNPNQGKTTSPEKKRNIIEGYKRSGKLNAVYSLNLITKQIALHESIKQCSRDTGINSADIGRVLRGFQKHSKEYYFTYEYIIDIENTLQDVFKYKKSSTVKNKECKVLDIETGTILKFKNSSEIKKYFSFKSNTTLYKYLNTCLLLNGKYKISRDDN